MPTNAHKIFCKPCSPQVKFVCLDPGHLLHDIIQVKEISEHKLGKDKGSVCFSYLLYPFSDKTQRGLSFMDIALEGLVTLFLGFRE